MRRPPLHPACKIFPALGREDLQQLADDIAENGLRNPIVMCNGKLLDGRGQKGVVGTAQHQGIDSLGDERFELRGDGAAYLCRIRLALDQLDPSMTGLHQYFGTRAVPLHEVLEFCTAEGAFGREDSNLARASLCGGGFDAGFHADDR